MLKMFFKFYEGRTYKIMDEKEIDKLFNFLTRTKETKVLGDFFRQVANAYRNKYLYTSDETLKGAVVAMTQLAEKFEGHTPKAKAEEIVRQGKIVGEKKNRIVKY